MARKTYLIILHTELINIFMIFTFYG